MCVHAEEGHDIIKSPKVLLYSWEALTLFCPQIHRSSLQDTRGSLKVTVICLWLETQAPASTLALLCLLTF